MVCWLRLAAAGLALGAGWWLGWMDRMPCVRTSTGRWCDSQTGKIGSAALLPRDASAGRAATRAERVTDRYMYMCT